MRHINEYLLSKNCSNAITDDKGFPYPDSEETVMKFLEKNGFKRINDDSDSLLYVLGKNNYNSDVYSKQVRFDHAVLIGFTGERFSINEDEPIYVCGIDNNIYYNVYWRNEHTNNRSYKDFDDFKEDVNKKFGWDK